MKKIRNYILYYSRLLIYKIFSIRHWINDVEINDLFLKKNNTFSYVSNKLKIIFTPQKKIGKLYIDSSLIKTDLCELGKDAKTDKSPYNTILHRHPYTAVYSLILGSLREKKINLAEIGILDNASIKMWRNYFSKAKIFGFEYDENMIKKAKKDNLSNVLYKKIDVTSNRSIHDSFAKCGVKFDLIIDDSTHTFKDQINIIKECKRFLVPGGILIIEDIPRIRSEYDEEKYYQALKSSLKFFNFVNFIDCDHINKFSKGWDNDKILILIRNEKK